MNKIVKFWNRHECFIVYVFGCLLVVDGLFNLLNIPENEGLSYCFIVFLGFFVIVMSFLSKVINEVSVLKKEIEGKENKR
jgi:hypothetical protein